MSIQRQSNAKPLPSLSQSDIDPVPMQCRYDATPMSIHYQSPNKMSIPDPNPLSICRYKVNQSPNVNRRPISQSHPNHRPIHQSIANPLDPMPHRPTIRINCQSPFLTYWRSEPIIKTGSTQDWHRSRQSFTNRRSVSTEDESETRCQSIFNPLPIRFKSVTDPLSI